MASGSRDLIAAAEAERLIKELGIDSLPIDPIAIAESLGILVRPGKTHRVIDPAQQVVGRYFQGIGEPLQIIKGWLARAGLEMGHG